MYDPSLAMVDGTPNLVVMLSEVWSMADPRDLRGLVSLAVEAERAGADIPVVVRCDGADFELVAGFHRIAAAQKLGLAEVPYVVRDAETEDTDRAVENITSCRRRHDGVR